jgi:hypothetical protein
MIERKTLVTLAVELLLILISPKKPAMPLCNVEAARTGRSLALDLRRKYDILTL